MKLSKETDISYYSENEWFLWLCNSQQGLLICQKGNKLFFDKSMLPGAAFFANIQVLANILIFFLDIKVEWFDLEFLTLAVLSIPVFLS